MISGDRGQAEGAVASGIGPRYREMPFSKTYSDFSKINGECNATTEEDPAPDPKLHFDMLFNMDHAGVFSRTRHAGGGEADSASGLFHR